jgi:hypothetical protein
VSAEHRKVMVLQGRYLGLGHKIPKGELAMFKSMISKVGKAEVVERMQAYVSAHQSKGDGPFPVKRGAGRKRRSRKK